MEFKSTDFKSNYLCLNYNSNMSQLCDLGKIFSLPFSLSFYKMGIESYLPLRVVVRIKIINICKILSTVLAIN